MDASSQGENGKDSGSSEDAAQQSLNSAAGMPTLPMMRGRVLFGLALGVIGICLGIIGAVFSSGVLTIVAAACAVAACFVVGGVALLPFVRRQEEGDTLNSRINAVMTPVDLDPTTPASAAASDQSVIDPVTEFPDARFFEVAVDGRVAAARRHLWPVSIVLLQLGFDPSNDAPEVHNRSLTTFAAMMRQTLREADIACRLDDNTFGLILEDTSEEGGVWTAERLQIALSQDATNIRRLVAGVAAYPTHGLFAKDVLVRAQAALHRASSTPVGHGLGQVEVAHVDLS